MNTDQNPMNPLPLNPTEPAPAGVFRQALERELEPTLMEGVEAAYKLSALDTATRAAARLLERKIDHDEAEAEGSRMLTVEELNTRFPDSPQPFTAPMREKEAEGIAAKQRERRELEQTVAKSKGALSWVANFGAALAPHVIDPIETSASLAVGMGIGKIAQVGGRAAWAARMLARAKMAGPAERTFVRAAAEGVAGNAVVEPLVYIANQKERQVYGVGDSAQNVLLGGVAFAGARWGVTKGYGILSQHGPRAIQGLHNAAERLLAKNRSPIPLVDAVVKDAEAQIHAKVPSGETKLAGAGVDPSVPVTATASRKLYAASPSTPDVPFDARQAVPLEGGRYGEGVYLTSDPDHAGSHAQREGEPAGSVHEMELPSDAKILDLENELPADVKAAVSEVLEEAGVKTEDDGTVVRGADDLDTLRKAEDAGELPEGVFAAVKAKLREQGYRALRYEGGSQREILMLLDEIGAGPDLARTRTLEGPDGFMGIALKLPKLPTVVVRGKDGLEIHLSAEMREVDVDSVDPTRTLKTSFPGVVARDSSGTEMGFMVVKGEFGEDGKFIRTPGYVEVSPEYRRRGIASALYEYANAYLAKLAPSATRTELGEAFGKSLNYDELDVKSQALVERAQELKSSRSFDPNPESARVVDEADSQKRLQDALLDDDRADLDYHADHDVGIKDLERDIDNVKETLDHEAEVQEFAEMAKAMDEQGLLDAESKAEIEEVIEIEKKGRALDIAQNLAAACLGRKP